MSSACRALQKHCHKKLVHEVAMHSSLRCSTSSNLLDLVIWVQLPS